MNSDVPSLRRKPPAGRLWTRVALLLSAIVMFGIISASHAYLTRAFSEDQTAAETVKATLYAGSIRSAVQRQSVVPLLLSRDPILIQALRTGHYGGAEERLASFKEELGSGSLFLLDAEGRIVAASDERPRTEYDVDKSYFTRAKDDPGSVFSITENEHGDFSFHYARRLMDDDKLLGVVVATVDLGQHEDGWRRAGARVVVSNSANQILLASEPNWRKQTLANLLAAGPDASRVGQVLRDARDRLTSPAFVYLAGTPYLRIEVPVGVRDWRLTYFQTLEDVRARVNGVLSLIIMVMALLLALGFYLVSRRTRAESRRIQRKVGGVAASEPTAVGRDRRAAEG